MFYSLREYLLLSAIWWRDNLFSVIAVIPANTAIMQQEQTAGVIGQLTVMEFKAIWQNKHKQKTPPLFPFFVFLLARPAHTADGLIF